MNATRTRKRHAPVRKYTFEARPKDDPAATPMVLSAKSVCAEDALRSVAADAPIGWTITLAGSQ